MNRPTVFVVDDEVQICELLTRILQREGYAVRSFTTGSAAVDAIASGRPDLILTDLMMPGISGIEVVRKARDILPDVGTILTTGYASIENVVDAMRSGVDDFVTKPFSVAEIREVVSRVLEISRSIPDPSEGPTMPIDADAVSATLARRFRDLSVVESVHGLLTDEFSSAELVPRCDGTIESALGARHSALLAPGERDGSFRVRSASIAHAPWSSGDDFGMPAMSLLAASGVAGTVDRDSLEPLAQLLDDGPIAAAPLCPRDPRGEDAGVLVISRPAGAADFGPGDFRVLGALTAAVGDVFRALRTAERAEDAYVESLCEIVAATEARCPWFARHHERVRALSIALGRRVGLSAAELDVLDIASRLLDLGRVEMPDEVLEKTGRPSAEQWRTLQRHPAVAADLVRPLGRLRRAKPVIRHHHENWDGSGYPDGLRGDDIPPLAALVRITDTFAALTAPRAWRCAVDRPSAVRQIVEMSGRHFHPQYVAAFAEMSFDGDASEGGAA